MNELLNIIHKTIYQFFDACEDDEEVPMSDKDKLLLEVNKAICNNLKAFNVTDIYVGDIISREAAYDEIIWNSDNGVIDAKVAIEALRKLPSVEPEQEKRTETHACDYISRGTHASDCISRQAVLDIVNNPLNVRLDEIIKKLPSVTPQPKIGRWIKTPKAVMGDGYMWYCDKCEHQVYQDSSKPYPSEKYCPNCGVKMVGSQESENTA